jgi:hypothetical protein
MDSQVLAKRIAVHLALGREIFHMLVGDRAVIYTAVPQKLVPGVLANRGAALYLPGVTGVTGYTLCLFDEWAYVSLTAEDQAAAEDEGRKLEARFHAKNMRGEAKDAKIISNCC